MIKLSEMTEKSVDLPFSPIIFGLGTFGLLCFALFLVTRLDSDR